MTRASLLPRRLPLLLLAAALALLLALPAVHDAPTAQAQAQKSIVFGYDLSPSFPYNDAVDEGAGTVRVPITVSELPASSLTVGVTAADITAEDGSDYTFGSQKTVTFSSTDSSRTQFVEFTVTDDSAAEGDEYLKLELSIPGTPTETYRPVGDPISGQAAAYLTIVDNDGPSSLTGNTFAITPSVTADEGSSATLTVSLGANAPTGGLPFTVTPSYCACGPTTLIRGAVDADVGTVPSTVHVPAGSRTATLTIPIATDTLVESNEDFRVSISTTVSGWSAANTSAAQATVIIADKTQPPPQDVAVAPGDASLTLTWQAPSSWVGATFRTFDIQWKLSSAPDSHWAAVQRDGSTVSPQAGTTSFEFTGDQENANRASYRVSNRVSYDLRMRASSFATGLAKSAWVEVTATPQEQREVWSATMTADAATTFFGCDNNDPTQEDCSTALTQDEFTFAGSTYTVQAVYWSNDVDLLEFGLDRDGTSLTRQQIVTALGSLTLHVDDDALPLSGDTSGTTKIVWPYAPATDWVDGQAVELKLTITPEYAGDLDPDFGIGGVLTTAFNTTASEINAVAVQPDGKIVAAGFAHNGSNEDFALARYNPDGSLDTSFGKAGRVTTDFGAGDKARAVAIQSDGKIVVAGYASVSGGHDFALARYNEDGTRDTTFGTSGSNGRVTTNMGATDEANALAIQPDGKIVVAGAAGANFGLARYNADGSLDTSFSTDGKVTTNLSGGSRFDAARAVAIQSDGKIVAAGYANTSATSDANHDFALARYTTTGAVDTTFSTDGKVTTAIGSRADEADAIAIQSDGKIVVAGFAKGSGNVSDVALARYTTAGALDTTFSTDGKMIEDTASFVPDEANAVAIQSDGKIVVAGFGEGAANDEFLLARFSSAGALDTSFGTFTPIGGGNSRARAMALLDDGGIVAAGYAHNGSHNDFALARYDDDGALHADFGIGGVVTTTFGPDRAEVAEAVAVQSDGKIVVAGYANNGTIDEAAVSRYNADGSLDTSFSSDGRVVNPFSSTTEERFHAVAIQSDGKILLAGYFNSGDDLFVVTRLTSAGALDTTFSTAGSDAQSFGSGDAQAHAVAIQTDGKIVLAGYANNGTDDDFALIRYTAAGALDTSFDTDGKVLTDFGGDDRAYAIAIQSDGKIVLAGYTDDGTDERFALARYNTDGSLDTSFSSDGKVLNNFGYSLERARAVDVDGEGRIIVAGVVSVDGVASSAFALARYTAGGDTDGSFGDRGRALSAFRSYQDRLGGARSLALQDDGKILVAGSANDIFHVRRYTGAGAPDRSFAFGGTNGVSIVFDPNSKSTAQAMALQSDGKIVVAGLTRRGAEPRDFALARLLGQGTFSGDATLSALAVSESPDGSAFSGTAALSPAFDPYVTSYEAALAEGTTHVQVTPTAGHAGATVTVGVSGGTAETVAGGSASSAIAVTPGTTVVEVVVTAEDGRTALTYTLGFAAAGEAGEAGDGPPPVRYGDAHWSASLTLGDIRGEALGCSTLGDPCDATDTLTADSFTLGGPRVTIDFLFVHTSQSDLNLGFEGSIPETLRHGATLVFDGRAFPLADATLDSDGDSVSWPLDADFPTYAAGQTVRVSLHRSVPPPDAALWKPSFDPQRMDADGETYGCRNGAAYTGPSGRQYPLDCSDSATLGLDGFSHTRTTYAGTAAEAWRVDEFYVGPRGTTSWGENVYQLVLTTRTAASNDPALPRGFTLTVTYTPSGVNLDGSPITDTHVRRFSMPAANVERGDGRVTYRWPLGHADEALVDSWRGYVQLGFDYPRATLSNVRVHYDGGHREVPTDVWSASLTAQDLAQTGVANGIGCTSGDDSGTPLSYSCANTGVFTDDDFTLAGDDYTVGTLQFDGTNISLVFASVPTPAQEQNLRRLVLHVDGKQYPVADAVILPGQVLFSVPTLPSAGDTVQLRLVELAQVIGVDSFTHWRPAGWSPAGLLAYIPKEFISRQTGEPVLTTHTKLYLTAAYAGSAIEWGKGTYDRPPAAFTPLAEDGFTDPIELEAFSAYTHVYVRVTNGDQSAVHRIIIDPPPRTYSLSPQVEVAEGEDAQVTLTLGSPATSGGVTFAVTAAFGDGGADEFDVGQVPATVTVPAGETTAVITIPTLDDVEVEDLLEHEERFTVSVAHGGYPAWAEDPDGTATSVVTIIDNDEPPGGPEPWSIRIVPGDGKLTVTWRMGERPGWDDADIRHALRWSQVSGVWANPRDPRAVGRNDGLATEPGAISFVITGLDNDVPTGVFVRSFEGNRRTPGAYNASERNPSSSEWVRVKGELTTPRAPRQQSAEANNPPTVLVPIGDVTIVNESGTSDVSLSAVFVDEDRDPLTVTAESSDTAKATVSVSADYSTLTVSAVARGTATVTVTAADGNGGTVEETFTVTVKAAPVAAKSIPDRSGQVKGTTRRVSLDGVFIDADGDALTVTASSSDTSVARVATIPDGSSLNLLAEAEGTATITVTARDPDGNEVSDEFDVTVVKTAPVVASPIDDVSGLSVGDTRDVSLSGVFTDADGDALTITAASSDEARAAVSVASDGSKLTLTGVAGGTATITVTARDPDGNEVGDEFDVSVVPATGKDYSALIAKMWEWRNNPPAGADATKHYNLWDRALLAMGETVEDTSLTPMPASEAQGYADRGWTRWVEVAAALKEIEQAAAQQQQQAPANNAPTVANAIPDATIVNASGTRSVSLSGVFADADNDSLTVTATSSDTAVATASVSADQSTLTVSAAARGTATVTVTASDGNGGSVEDAFTVTVKAAPTVASAIPDVSGLEVDATQDVSLSGVFSDADGDSLTITAVSTDTAKATVSVASDGSKLTLTGVAEGTATVTVTARDSDGNQASDAFDVSVVKKYAALIAQMREWRNDPNHVDNKEHTDRWDRALLAFGETVADSTLTAMGADEAQTYADRGWERWTPVAKALKEMESDGG